MAGVCIEGGARGRHTARILSWIVGFVFLTGAGLVSAADVSWVGPANGQWTNGANWSGGSVPTPEDNVTISGATVTVSDIREIGGSFTLSGNALLQVIGSGASFAARGETALSDGRVVVREGASASFPNAGACAFTLDSNELLFHAVGEGSTLDLSGITSIVVMGPEGEAIQQNVIAADGGVIDFSGLESITAADNQQLSLSTITSGAILAPNLADVERGFIVVNDTTMLDLPALARFVNSSMLVTEGGMLTANNLTEAHGCTFSIGGLDAVALDRLEALIGCQFSLNNTGRVTLHALTGLHDSIIQVGGGAFLNMPELVTLEATALGALVSTNGSGSLSAPKLRAVRNVVFVASDNAALNLPLVETYLWDLCEGAAIFTAGTGATVNFSGLQTLTVANTGCSGLGYNVGATGGSTIDLSGLRSAIVPASHFLTFLASNTDTVIDISALTTFNATITTFLELDSGRILRSGSGGGEGEGEGEGEGPPPGCPAPAAGARSSSAAVFGDFALMLGLAALLGAAGRIRTRRTP